MAALTRLSMQSMQCPLSISPLVCHIYYRDVQIPNISIYFQFAILL